MTSKSKKRRFSDEEDDSSSEDSDNNDSSKSKRAKSNSSNALDASRTSIDTTSSEASSNSDSEAGDQNVRVIARLRPLSVKEKAEQSKETIKALTKSSTIMVDKNRKYEYDAVLGPNTAQHQVYEQTAGDMVKSNIFKGFNVTILAYGQTGSGKTFTMGTSGDGNNNALENEGEDENGKNTPEDEAFLPPTEGDGIIPRAVYDLFKTREEMKCGRERVTVKMSYLEIYNETCRDLLCDDPSSKVLHIRDSKTDGVYVQNLSSVEVNKPSEVSDLMDSASGKRATASTQMNAVSSRSHAICTLDVIIAPQEDIDDDEAEESSEIQIQSKLTLVDLAGSERIKRTGAEGSRMKEGININKGLFVLGQVVSSLSELGQQGNQPANSHLHIPYRDSKLTRLLQDSLGGNSRTILVACISPADSNVEESINTLRYASRARNIKNSAVQNVVATSMSPAEAAALRRENQMLKLQLVQMESKLNSQPSIGITTMISNNALRAQPDASNVTSTALDVDISGLDVEKLEIVSRLRTKCVSLQSKISQLEDQNVSASEDALTASLKADRAQLKLEQALATAKSQNVTLFTDMNAEKESSSLAEELRKELTELKSRLQAAQAEAAVARATAAAVVAGDGDLSTAEELALASESDDSNGSSESSKDDKNNEHLTAALVAVSGEIEQKEAMALQVNKERECMEVMQSHFESAIKSLQSEVDVLSSERESLLEKMTQKSGGTNAKARTRIKELENRIKDLKSKATEHNKSLRMREIAEKKCTQLSAEILADKKRRAALQRKLKEESEERRSEKKAAQREATRMLRNSHRLKIELQKVKDEATRQAAVLRRKAAEALSRQKKQAEMQRKRSIASAMRAQAKNGRKRPGSSSESDERRDELAKWLEREVEASMTLQQTREQIEEQTILLDEVLSKKEDASDDMDIGALRALDSEIDSRRAIIKQLERNAQDFQRAFDGTGGSNKTETKTFQDASTWNNLSRSEVKLVFSKAFERLVAIKNEAVKLRSTHAEEVAKAANKAIVAERRSTDEKVVKLKLEHSEAMAALLESTKAAMEREVKTKLLKQGDGKEQDISLQCVVDDMLKKYLDSCNQVGEKVKEELQDVKTHQNGLKQMMDLAANGIIAKNEAAAKKKKKKKPRKSIAGNDEEVFVFEEEEELGEDSDDSDWSPDTPAKKKQKINNASAEEKKHKINNASAEEKVKNDSIESTTSSPIQLVGERISIEPEEVKVDIQNLESLRVIELKDMLKKHGLPVSGKKSELIARLQTHIQSSTDENKDVDKNETHSEQKFHDANEVAIEDNEKKNSSRKKSREVQLAQNVRRTSARRKSAASQVESDEKENQSQQNTEVTKPARRTRGKSQLTQAGSREKENAHQERSRKRKPLAPAISEESERNKIVSFAKDENSKISPSDKVGTETREKLTLSARKRRRKNMNLAVDKALQEVDKLKDIGDFAIGRRRS